MVATRTNIYKRATAGLVYVGIAIAAIGWGDADANGDRLGFASTGALFQDKSTHDEINCLALNIYWEARSEPEKGQIAVAKVTVNRMVHPDFPNTICNVVKQGSESAPARCQFSWWCDGKSDRPKEQDAWQAATSLAAAVISGGYPDPTKGAVYFHHQKVRPAWSARKRFRSKIGAHLFYR